MLRRAWTIGTIFLLVSAAWCGEAIKQIEEFPPVVNKDCKVTAEMGKVWVADTHFWVLITGENISKEEVWLKFPVTLRQQWFAGFYRYQLRRVADGKVVFSEYHLVQNNMAAGIANNNGHMGPRRTPEFEVKPGQSDTKLFQIPWIATDDVKDGEYDLELDIYAPGTVKQRITVRRQTEEEKAALKGMGKRRPLYQEKEDLSKLQLPKSLLEDTGLAFELMVQRVVKSKRGEADLSLFDAKLPTMFSPMVSVLKFDELMGRGAGDQAKKLKAESLKKNIGLKDYFDQASTETGVLYWPRERQAAK